MKSDLKKDDLLIITRLNILPQFLLPDKVPDDNQVPHNHG